MSFDDESLALEIHEEHVDHVSNVFLKYLFVEEVSPGEMVEICGNLLRYVINNSTISQDAIKRLVSVYTHGQKYEH